MTDRKVGGSVEVGRQPGGGRGRSLRARILATVLVPGVLLVAAGGVLTTEMLTRSLADRAGAVARADVVDRARALLVSIDAERRLAVVGGAPAADLEATRDALDLAGAALLMAVTRAERVQPDRPVGGSAELGERLRDLMDRRGAAGSDRLEVARVYGAAADAALGVAAGAARATADPVAAADREAGVVLLRAADLVTRAALLPAPGPGRSGSPADAAARAVAVQRLEQFAALDAELDHLDSLPAPSVDRARVAELRGAVPAFPAAVHAVVPSAARSGVAGDPGGYVRSTTRRDAGPAPPVPGAAAMSRLGDELLTVAAERERDAAGSALRRAWLLGAAALAAALGAAALAGYLGLGAIRRMSRALGDARDALERAALAEAAAVANAQAGVAGMLRNVARRNRDAMAAQQAVLREAEVAATDPDEFGRLATLGELTRRAVRDAENIMIVTGARPGPVAGGPVPLVEIVCSLSGPAALHDCVVRGRTPGVAIAGNVAGDLERILAELVDNAGRFSPPGSPVEISAELVGRGLVVEVEDRGPGLAPDRADEINGFLASPPPFHPLDLAGEAQLGLTVVARMADRHGILVTLRGSAYGGARAVVFVPSTLLAGEPQVCGPLVGPGARPAAPPPLRRPDDDLAVHHRRLLAALQRARRVSGPGEASQP